MKHIKALCAAFFFVLSILLISCDEDQEINKNSARMNSVAEAYVKLVLQVGQHDPNYVDFYYGPEKWRPAPLDSVRIGDAAILSALSEETRQLQHRLNIINDNTFNEIEKLRYNYLVKQLQSVSGRVDMLSGEEKSFDEESKALYDAVAPVNDEAHFEEILSQLGQALPGYGNISRRLQRFRSQFVIPVEKLDDVFQAAISEGRKRTHEFIEMPQNERFKVEYVTGKSWSAYNWYKGNSFSIIQVNTDLPIYIDRAIDLACHEGYPGHHAFSTLQEEHLTRRRSWIEYSIYPLFSPQSLISEGTANYGIEMAFPGHERIQFEKEVLWPLAGLDTTQVERYYEIQEMVRQLAYADNEAARNFLDGNIQRWEAIRWLRRYALMTADEAEQRLQFIEEYRSYVINYNLGQDIVKRYIERHSSTGVNNRMTRWNLFARLLTVPLTPSRLK